MDPNEVYSPGSRTHQSSFGILDEKAMQDLSLENLHKIRDKPPIPLKQINNRILQERKLNQEKSFNFDPSENPDQTQESVHLNESELKQLEYDYTLDIDDDDDDPEDKENIKNPRANFNNTSDLRDASKNFGHSFAKTDFTNVSPNNMTNLDKSVNMTLSNEKINSDLLIDESSGILRNSGDFESSNSDHSNRSNYSSRNNYSKIDEAKNKTQNNTINFTMDISSTDHSTKPEITFTEEKTNPSPKKLAPECDTTLSNELMNKNSASFNLTGIDDTATCLKQMNLSQADKLETKNETTLNFSSNLSDRMEQLIQQSVERVKRIGQAHLTNNYADEYLNLISKPGKDLRYSTSTVRPDPKNGSFNFTQDIPLTPSKTFNQTLEPQEEPKITQENEKQTNHNPFDSAIQNSQHSFQANPFDNPFNNSLGNFGLNQDQNLEPSFSQFKQADDFLDQLDQDEQINRKEFADNELTLMNQTSGNSSNDSNSSKWWRNPNQIQPSNLEITNVSSESGKKQVKVEDFFMGKSDMPSYLKEKQSDVRLSDVNQNENDLIKEKQIKQELSTPQTYDDITFSHNQGSTLSSSNFSFTLNSSDTGDFIQPKNSAKKSMEKPKQGSQLKNLDKINEELDRVQNRLASKQQISEPLMSSSMSQTNRKTSMHIDETISSINSSDVSNQKAAKHKDHKSSKESKKCSGSLTSTPSKMTKSISESSNLNRLTGTSLMEKFYKSENQDSFISSIPERNDSTLISNHKHKNNKIAKKQKNAEIQTASEENRQSISNVSSTSSTSSDPSNTINSQFNVINNLAAAMINNSTNSNNPANGLVPVAFIPFNSFIPCVQKFYDDMQTTQALINKTNFSSNVSTNSLNQAMNTKLLGDTLYSNSTASISSAHYGKFELPIIEFDKTSIDFGHIAEGCRQILRLHGKLTNPNLINKTPGSYFQIELVDSTDWTIDSYAVDLEEKEKKIDGEKPSGRIGLIKKKFNESTLRSKLRKILSINADRNVMDDTNNKVSFDLMVNLFEFFIKLDTSNLNFFKDFISQLDPCSVDQVEPLQIKSSLYIYYYLNSAENPTSCSILKKYLLNRIDIKLVLGYARLRSSSYQNFIDFEIPEEASESARIDSFCEDKDKTLTSVNEMNTSKNVRVIEQAISLSNAGNIDIEVECFLTLNEQQVLSVKFRDYDLKLDDSLLYLQSKLKQKQFAKILATKLTGQLKENEVDEKQSVKLVVEIKPNGFKFEFPINLRFVKKKIENIKNIEKKSLKLSSSRPILFFGNSLNSSHKYNQHLDISSGLTDEFLIANSNNFRIKVQLTLTCSNYNCFKFSNEMIQANTKLNDSMTVLNLTLEPSENFKLKIKFNPSTNTDSQVINGVLKMTAVGFTQKFNVYLVAFNAQSLLEIDSGLKEILLDQKEPLGQQLIHRNIKNFSFSVDLMQTSSTSVRSVFRKILRLKNNSCSKLIAYPCVYNSKIDKELLFDNGSKITEIVYDLGSSSNGFWNRLRLLANKESQFSSSAELKWIEIKPNEVFVLNLEILSQKLDYKKTQFFNIEDFKLCFFWIEYDINSYCTQLAQNANSTSRQWSTFLDLHLSKLISNNSFFSTHINLPANALSMNDSSAKLHRLSSASAMSFQEDSSISNSSIISKSKFTKDDCMRLMRQSVKCSILSMCTESFNLDETVEKKDGLVQISLSQDEKSSDLIESWLVSPSSITMENLKNNEISKIFLKNNLVRKEIEFDVKYRSSYLSVLPSNGIIEPNGLIELIVKPRPEVFAQLPWSGVISIWCNKIQKDVRISFYSKNDDNTPSLTNSSTPYPNSIEVGSLMSDLTQYSIDSLSLTPLISASFMNAPSSTFLKSKSFSLNSTNDESSTKIVRDGNDAHVRFPAVCVTQRKSIELTLTNPTNSYVNWKAYSTMPAFVRPKDDDKMQMKSNYSAFFITPNSGAIPPNQNQKIKIEFCPREVYGLFNQYWEIDTRTDLQNLMQSPDADTPLSYTCKLRLTGTSIPMEKNLEQKLVQQDDSTSSRLANRLLRSKTNTFADGRKESEKSYGNSSSLIAQSMLSSTSNSLLSSAKNRVIIKEEVILFPDTIVNQMNKGFVTIHNRESIDCRISVFTLIEPFFCKHVDLNVAPKHYIKIPIEFRPKAVGEYSDKILIKVDIYEVPLSCTIKAKCVQN